MTDQEAEEILKTVEPIQIYSDDESKTAQDGFDVLKAIDLAIKALEREPCKDAVSREKVLEIINNPMEIRLDLAISRLPSVRPQTVDWDRMIKDTQTYFKAKIEDSTEIDAVDTSAEIIEIINKYRNGGIE